MDRSHEELPSQDSTLSGSGRKWIPERPTFSTPSDKYNFPQTDMAESDCLDLNLKLSSGIPTLSNSVNYSSGASSDEPNRVISVKATVVAETHGRVKMKSGIVSAPQQTIVHEPVVESVAGEVAADIEFNLLNSNNGNEPVVDPFTIKKKLRNNDIKFGLYLGKDLVPKHILPFLNDQQKNLINVDGKDGGAIIKIFHRETNSEYEMQIHTRAPSYAFKNGWTKRFVTDMNIEEGDTFGMYWDRDASRFVFSVLKQSRDLSHPLE